MYNFEVSNKDVWKNIEGISSKYFFDTNWNFERFS